MRLTFTFDSGGPGGRGGWVLIGLAVIVAVVLVVRIIVESHP